MTEPFLDQKMIHQLLEYNRETGLFTWRERPGKKAWNTRYSGKTAGSRWSPDGKTTYIVIRIFDWPFLAHRLAILYVTGIWPDALVDHENTDGTDNRWENLREATAAENGANRSKNSNNTSGFKGVSRTKNGKFRATIQVRGFWKQIGIFEGNYILYSLGENLLCFACEVGVNRSCPSPPFRRLSCSR